MSERLIEQLVARLSAVELQLDELETPEVDLIVSVVNVSNPPTNLELNAIFAPFGAIGAGFAAIVDDAGADANVWFVVFNGTSWWYEALTKAV